MLYNLRAIKDQSFTIYKFQNKNKASIQRLALALSSF